MSFGYNYRGQLGHGNTISEPVPKPVQGLDGIRVKQVSCSYYHSVVASEQGQVRDIFLRGKDPFPIHFGSDARAMEA